VPGWSDGRGRAISRPGVAGSSVTVAVTFVTYGGGEDETIGRREGVVDGAVRARAGQGVRGLGAADVAGVLAGRPTREALMGRAAAVGRYRVGAPLPFEDLRFARSHIGVAVALVWLAPGESGVPGHGAGGDRRGRGVLCGHGLPADPFRRGRAGGRRVAGRVGHGDIRGDGGAARWLVFFAVWRSLASMIIPGGWSCGAGIFGAG